MEALVQADADIQAENVKDLQKHRDASLFMDRQAIVEDLFRQGMRDIGKIVFNVVAGSNNPMI